MVPSEVQQRIEAYLSRLRERLCGVKDQDVREIIEELRGHILEKAGLSGEVTAARIDVVLAALGSPEELASEYLTDDLLARAEISRSPVRILQSLFRWADLSVAGFIVLMTSIGGYFLGAVFILAAVLKPFHPQSAGLWIFPSADDFEISLRLGFERAPANGRDLLGLWIIPVGLVMGCGLVILTTRFALSCARRYRKSQTFVAKLMMPKRD